MTIGAHTVVTTPKLCCTVKIKHLVSVINIMHRNYIYLYYNIKKNLTIWEELMPFIRWPFQ